MKPVALSQRHILRIWWPLAASWLLMGAEMPLVVAAISRLPDATTQLAAIGSIVYPISLLVEGPIIMLLAASTALARDRASYAWLSRVMWWSAGALTLVHAAIAFTPLYDVVARDLLDAPEAAVEPGRLGLMLMTPWSPMIAYRRFQQGVLIRFDRSNAVGTGTLIRLAANAAVLVGGVAHGGFSGVAIGATAIATGVTAEAIYAAIVVRPVRRERLPSVDEAAPPLTLNGFLSFYTPLAITPFLALALQPVGAAAMNRMPDALRSVASWSAVYGLIFLLRSFGFAFHEVAVRLADEPGGRDALRTFAVRLSLLTSGALVLLWATPLAEFWFRDVSGLPSDLVAVSTAGVGFGMLMPGYAVWMNYYQGVLVQQHRTRAVTSAVFVYVVISGALLGVGVATQSWPGLPGALGAFTVAGLLQTAYLRLAARS